jgi:hypothetical protein
MYNFAINKSTPEFVIYEFTDNKIDYFVRFYKKEDKLWRRGYWFREKKYFEDNIKKIEDRLPNETDSSIIDRLNNELQYFKEKINTSKESNFFNQTNPLKLINIISEITYDFLKNNFNVCDVLEIQHMKKDDEPISIRAKLNERILPKYLDNKWNYLLIKSTSYVFKKDVNLDDYNLEIY